MELYRNHTWSGVCSFTVLSSLILPVIYLVRIQIRVHLGGHSSAVFLIVANVSH